MIADAAGATILACGLGLLSVASSGQGQMWGVSLCGGGSAVGSATGPVVGGVLNEVSGGPPASPPQRRHRAGHLTLRSRPPSSGNQPPYHTSALVEAFPTAGVVTTTEIVIADNDLALAEALASVLSEGDRRVVAVASTAP